VKLFQNIFIYTISDIVPKSLAFFMVPLLTRHLTVAEYGIFGYLQALITFLTLLFTLGLNGAATRFFFEMEEPEQRRKLMGTIFMLLALNVICMSVLLLTTMFLLPDSLFTNIPLWPFYPYAIFSAALFSFLGLPLALAIAEKKAITFGVLQSSRTITIFGAIVILVIWNQMGAEGIIYGYLLSSLLIGAISLQQIFKQATITFPSPHAREILAFSIPLLPHAIAGWILQLSDRLFLERLSNLEQLGIYSAACQLGLVMDLLMNSIKNAAIPYYYQLLDKVDYARELLGELLHLVIPIFLIISLGLILISREVFTLLVDQRYSSGQMIYIMTVFMGLFHGLYFCTIPIIMHRKKTRWLAATTGIVAFINFGLNALLIPIYQAWGAALATLVSYALLFLLTVLASQQLLTVSWPFKRLLGGLVIISVATLLSHFIEPAPVLSYLAYKIGLGISGSILIVAIFFRGGKVFYHTKQLMRDMDLGNVSFS